MSNHIAAADSAIRLSHAVRRDPTYWSVDLVIFGAADRFVAGGLGQLPRARDEDRQTPAADADILRRNLRQVRVFVAMIILGLAATLQFLKGVSVWLAATFAVLLIAWMWWYVTGLVNKVTSGEYD